MTADGKLAPANRIFVPFGSKRDQQLLLELRAEADAVMSGARTVDLSEVNLGPGPERLRQKRLRRGLTEYNLRVVVSGSGTLDPDAAIFRKRFSPIIILTTGRISTARLRKLRAVADDVKVCGKTELDFALACRWLRQRWGVKHLLCEGGGELNQGLLRAGIVDEIYITLCPWILGGRKISRVRHSQIPADFTRKKAIDFIVTRDGGTLICRRITPPRVIAAFANEYAAVSPQMAKQLTPLHTRMSSCSIPSPARARAS